MGFLGVISDRGDSCPSPPSLWRAIEEDRPVEIDVVNVRSWILEMSGAQSDGRGFVGVIRDKENFANLYSTAVRVTQPKAREHAEAMLGIFRWLYERRLAGLNDPGKAIAWGVEQRKAEHGQRTLSRVG